MSTVSRTTTHQSPLLSLPAELRTAIWRHALITKPMVPVPIIDGSRPRKPPSILSACQQIRQEASPVYYGENTFHFAVPFFADGKSTLARWFQALSKEQRNWIKEVNMEYVPSGREAGERFMLSHLHFDALQRLYREIGAEHVRALVDAGGRWWPAIVI